MPAIEEKQRLSLLSRGTISGTLTGLKFEQSPGCLAFRRAKEIEYKEQC
jgi:hypothetical protein